MWRVTVFLATLAIAMFMGSGERALAQSTVVRIEPAWKVTSPYEPSFSVEVRVDDVVTRNPCTPWSPDQPCGLGTYQFTVVYEPTVIEFDSVVNGDFLGSTGRTVSCNTYPDTDRVRFACTSQSAPGEPGPMGPEGSGLLATLTFAPLQIGDSPVDLVNVVLGDVTGDPIFHTVQDGSVTVDYQADLSVEKTAPATVTAPGNIEYGVQVTNQGPDEAENVTVVDTLSSHVEFVSAPGCTYDPGQHQVTCGLGNIGATLSESASITVSVGATAAGRTIVNGADASSATVDPNASNNHAEASTTVNPANVDIVKTAPDQVEKGATDQYEIVVTSTGPSEAGLVEITDLLPSDVLHVSSVTTLGECFYWDFGEPTVWCDVGDMPMSSAATITITVTFPDFDWYVCNKAESEWGQFPPGLNESEWACTEVGEPDRDGDGCFNWIESGMGRDPDNPWDFYDVPIPATPDPDPNGSKNHAIAMDDVLGVLFYVGTYEGDGGSPNANGVAYDVDKDGDTQNDGIDYDRTPAPPFSGPPDQAVAMDDVLAVLIQTGASCVVLP